MKDGREERGMVVGEQKMIFDELSGHEGTPGGKENGGGHLWWPGSMKRHWRSTGMGRGLAAMAAGGPF